MLSTEGDWLRELAHHLRRGEAALRAGAPSRAAVVARLTAEGTPADTTKRFTPRHSDGHEPEPEPAA